MRLSFYQLIFGSQKRRLLTRKTIRRLMNLNTWEKELTLAEGKKVSLTIAQTKEILRLILIDLSNMSLEDITKLIGRIKK